MASDFAARFTSAPAAASHASGVPYETKAERFLFTNSVTTATRGHAVNDVLTHYTYGPTIAEELRMISENL